MAATWLSGQNIVALGNAGSNVIVDDLTYFDEPFFQDGLISQAVNTVVGMGDTYLSAAGNRANDGYLSNFRSVSANIPGAAGQGTIHGLRPEWPGGHPASRSWSGLR